MLPFDTDFVFVIRRTHLLGAKEVLALSRVMESYRKQPLSSYRGQRVPADHAVDWPVWNDAASRGERFIGYLNFQLSFCQPVLPSEIDLMERFAQAGIGAGLPFNADALIDLVRRPYVMELLKHGKP